MASAALPLDESEPEDEPKLTLAVDEWCAPEEEEDERFENRLDATLGALARGLAVGDAAAAAPAPAPAPAPAAAAVAPAPALAAGLSAGAAVGLAAAAAAAGTGTGAGGGRLSAVAGVVEGDGGAAAPDDVVR